jgi:hypothetical protein
MQATSPRESFMSADASTRREADNLQFDRAVDPSAPDAAGGAPVCSSCSAAIRMYYYDVDGATVCSTCKQGVERASGGGSAKGGMLKVVLAGLGAAVAGAIIYYSVMEYLNLEIGYVAILIGFMVGYAVRSAAAGRGGRRYQLLAAGLTYFAVALAYAPFALRGGEEGDAEDVAADSVAVVSDAIDPSADAQTATDTDADDADPATPNVAAEQLGFGGIALGLGGGLLFVLALPVIVILGSMPSGLISAAIIGFGIHQAWSMTKGAQVSITGPFRVGTERATGTA